MPKRRKARQKVRQSLTDNIFDFFNILFLSLCTLAVLYPLIFILSASFSAPTAVVSGKVFLLPVEPTTIAYETIFKYRQITIGYYNAVLYTVSATFVGVLVTFFAAYPLSRRGLPGRNQIMGLFVFTMLFSGGLIPTYLVVRALGMVNTRWAVMFPMAISVWNIIIMRTFFQVTLPQELFDSAEIDGASELRIMFRIVVPLSGPVFAVVVLNWAVWIWNSYYYALIYLRSNELQPLQIILRQILIMNETNLQMSADELIRKQGLVDVLRYALIVVASAPLLMVYPFLQKYFTKGVMIGSVKG
jgi:ABC-type glycerol-3-phosphate transport system permease component